MAFFLFYGIWSLQDNCHVTKLFPEANATPTLHLSACPASGPQVLGRPHHLPSVWGRGGGWLASAQAEAMLMSPHLLGSSGDGLVETSHSLQMCPAGTEHLAQVRSFKSILVVIATVRQPKGLWGALSRCIWKSSPKMPFDRDRVSSLCPHLCFYRPRAFQVTENETGIERTH